MVGWKNRTGLKCEHVNQESEIINLFIYSVSQTVPSAYAVADRMESNG